MTDRYQNYIDGKWEDAPSGEHFENRSPADRDDLIGIFPLSGPADVDRAVQAADRARASWKATPATKRGEIIRAAGRILERRKEEIARLMTREMGKILIETRGDVQEGIDTAEYASGEGRRLFGQTVPCELPQKAGFSIRQPVGVCGMITPWNFPMAIPTWKIFPALIAGNTVVFKPATDTPACAGVLVKVLEEAGVPPGVVNLVYGSGSAVGTPLTEHDKVRCISFTGSTEVGRAIAEVCGRTLKKLSLEMGGKNAQIVLADADMDLALEGVLWGAFGTTGQRCTATSRLILEKSIAADFTERLVARARELRVGNGLDESIEMGPLVNEGQVRTVSEYVEIGKGEGARLAIGGSPLTEGDHAKGHFFQPTIFDRVEPGMRIAQEEIFGPVLSVIEVDGGLEQAIAVCNDSRFGLSSSIYTRDVNAAFRAIDGIEAGITYVNGPTIGAEVQLPFGGVKETGNGHRESGTAVYDVFTEWKSVYVDYSGRLQKAQIDTE